MTKEEVRALIKAKIEGQGSAIDAGSVLPAILNGIIDLIDEGGGGTSDAVQYIPQELTESQQMQARKNLDLYYETEQQTNTVNGTDEGEIYADIWKHISDDTPNRARKIVSVKRGEEEVAFSVDDTMIPEGYMLIKNEDGDESWFLVIISPNSHYQGLPAGIYVATSPATVLELSLEYVTAEGETVKIPEKFLPETPSSDPEAVKYVEQELTDAQKMQARKNQDLYYSEGTPAGVITWDGNTEGKERIELEEGSDIWLYKIADSPVNIPADKITSVLDANGDAINMSIQDASNILESGSLVFGHLYSADYQQYYAFAIANNPQNPSDSSIQALVGLTGIYVTDNVRTINYDAYDGDIHHIDPKYIKDMYYEEEGIVEITTPLYDVQEVVNGTEDGYYFKVNTDIPSREQISGLILQGQAVNFELLNFDDAGYSVCDSGGYEYFIVLFSKYNTGGGILEPGIYIYASKYSSSLQRLVYEGTTTTVHQIPAKYIPDMPSSGAPAVKMEIPSMGDDVYYNMAQLNVNQVVPTRGVVFSVEGRTVLSLYVVDVINGGGNGEQGDTYTFGSGGLYWVQVELDYEYGLPSYMCAMVYVESDNQ